MLCGTSSLSFLRLERLERGVQARFVGHGTTVRRLGWFWKRRFSACLEFSPRGTLGNGTLHVWLPPSLLDMLEGHCPA